MTLEVIYLTRHGVTPPPYLPKLPKLTEHPQFRSNWVVDPKTGTYSASIPSPTGIPSDPALAGYGVTQSHELAAHLSTLSPPIERFYSSPFYRCIQTISPALEALSPDQETLKIRGENGVGEWYGLARFDHPGPAEPKVLKGLFHRYDESYKAVIKPSVNGESIEELHNRSAYALHKIIEQSDREGVKAIVICTHAATLIAIGRVLTGRMPEDIAEEDFRPFTCGLSTFVRKSKGQQQGVRVWEGPESRIPEVEWKGGEGVGGGWRLEGSGDCNFLSGGEERGLPFLGG
jgi:transcription factor C subunit 7